ncbi:MAG: V-type ATP synthase subunit I [Euryarchaeota archaeon]|nr:V-type ATP synthase subunit I [Euryarchaeota archaeon]
MFRPEKLSRTVIIGSKDYLERTIELLHELEIVDIIEYSAKGLDPDFKIGKPIVKSSGASDQVLTLRSSAKLLDLDEEKHVDKKMTIDEITKDLDGKIQTLEKEIISVTQEKTTLDEQLFAIDDQIARLIPFSSISIPLENYFDHAYITVFVGSVQNLKKFEKILPSITDEYELFYSSDAENVVVLFVSKSFRETVFQTLTDCQYTEIKIPSGTGLPVNLIEQLENDRSRIHDRLETISKNLEKVRRKHGEFILAAEEYLSIEVQKAEAPIKFATTTHSFIIDCWIPTKNVEHVKKTLEDETNNALYIETLEIKSEDDVPVLLDNPKSVKPFEFLLDLYSTPTYHEIDPSFILSLIFPLFFGFMIGDLGYGLLLIIFGYIFIKKLKDNEGWYNIGRYIIVAGIFASIFGLFLFGDFLGLPFQSPPHETGQVIYSWSSLFSTNIPIQSLIHKTETSGITQLLVLSIIAGFLHLSLGLIIGMINERKHSIKHAFGKLGLLFVLTAFTLLIFVMAKWTISQWLVPLKTSAVASFLWPYFITPLSTSFMFSGLFIPYATVIFGLIGLLIILVSLGGLGLIEMLEIAGHLMSYTRLAAIGVAKGALAFAFNVIGIGLILNGNIIIGIIGVVVLVILQLLVLALGSLSSGIQALRLHYVEFFMKFYKGGGKKFEPFGYKRRYTTTQ